MVRVPRALSGGGGRETTSARSARTFFTDDGATALFDETYDAFSGWYRDHYLSQSHTTLFVASSYTTGTPPRSHRQEKLAVPIVAVKRLEALRWTQRRFGAVGTIIADRPPHRSVRAR